MTWFAYGSISVETNGQSQAICLFGWGAAGPEDFDKQQLAAYRKSWRDPATVAGYCNDYRATLAVDLADDLADQGKRVAAPVQIFYGAAGAMSRHYDIPATWSERCASVEAAAIPGGHFFPDSAPEEVIKRLGAFNGAVSNTRRALDSWGDVSGIKR